MAMASLRHSEGNLGGTGSGEWPTTSAQVFEKQSISMSVIVFLVSWFYEKECQASFSNTLKKTRNFGEYFSFITTICISSKRL
jgi:hypothetical protein